MSRLGKALVPEVEAHVARVYGVEHGLVSVESRDGLLEGADSLETSRWGQYLPQTVRNALAIDCRFLAEHR